MYTASSASGGAVRSQPLGRPPRGGAGATKLAEERLRIKYAVTGRLNWVLAEASTAWEHSKEPTVTEEVDEKGVVRRRITTSSGNPQFLREFRAANSELIDLWGVQGAIQHEQHNKQTVQPSHMTDEEFEASMAGVRQQRDRLIRMRAKMKELNNN